MATMTYFEGIRGRMEVSVLVMAAAGKLKQLNQKRISFADWPALKPNTPWEGLPYLEINGKMYGQSIAVQKFLAMEYGGGDLYPKGAEDQLLIDSIALAREDLLIAEGNFAFAADEAAKKEMQGKLDKQYDQFLPKIEKILSSNTSGFAVGKKMTLADIIIFEGTQGLSQHQASTLEKYPAISALRAKVAGTKGIKEYLADRKAMDL